MELKDLLQQYAIESGEIPESPVVDENGLIEQDAHDLLDAKIDEIVRANDLVDSLEALADRYSSIPVSDVSFESYQFTLGHVLAVSGIEIPTSVFVPSFESAEKSEGKSFKEKAKGAIDAIIKWIKEKFAALRDFLLRRKKSTDDKVNKAKADAKEANAAILQLKHNPRKGYATGQQGDEKASGKHGSDNSANKQNDHLAKDAKGKTVGEGDVKRNSHGGLGAEPIKLPSFMVNGDGKLDMAKFSHVLARMTKSGPLYNFLAGDMPDGSHLMGKGYANDLDKVKAALAVSVNKLLDDALETGRGHVTCDDWKPEELAAAAIQLADNADLMRKMSEKITQDILVTERNLSTAVANSQNGEASAAFRELTVAELKWFKKRQGLAEACLQVIVDGVNKISTASRKAA